MKLIKKGNKLLFQNNNGRPTQTLDLSVIQINFQNNKIAFLGTDLEIDFEIFESIEDENGTIKYKTDFANFEELEKYLQENIFFLTTSGGANGQEFTGIIEANMEQAFNICDIYPNKSIYEVSAKITSSNLTNTATVFYNQKQSENNGFVSLLTYFIDDSQNKPLLFFPQNCVNLQNKLQIIVKNNTNELISFQLLTK
jgi:hypothetical protein